MLAALNNSIAVTITYNSGMDADAEDYYENPVTGLALRVLYSALVQDTPEAYPFDRFCSDWTSCATSHTMRLNLQLAVDACMLAFSELAPGRTGILLLIDETRKLAEAFERKTGRGVSDRSNRVYDMLGAVGRALDCNRPAVFNAACTTLDSLMLQAVTTVSGRQIDWICLDGLRQPATEAMVMRALGLPCASRVPVLVALSIADCARHPRTLEWLVEALLLRAGERTGCPDWFNNSGELKLIRRMVARSLTSTSPLWAVQAALNGVALPYDAVIAGSGGMTFGDAIATGVFLNTVDADTKGVVDVPRLSFMHLLHAADALPSPVRIAILGMAATEEAVFDAPRKFGTMPFGGMGFEGFILRWLQLRFGLAAAAGTTEGLSLEALFSLTLSESLPSAAWQSFSRRLVMGLPSYPHRFFHVALPDVDFTRAITDPQSRRLIDEVITGGGGVVTFIANNPAFNILLFVRETVADAPLVGAAAPPLLAIAIEARFSSPGSEMRTTAENVKSKVNLFTAQCGPDGVFAALGIPSDRVTYVVMASRLDGPHTDSEQQSLTQPPSERGLTASEKVAFFAQGIIVLDRAGVERALTPTLVDRAFFLLPAPRKSSP